MLISDVRIYNHALNMREIEAAYRGRRPTPFLRRLIAALLLAVVAAILAVSVQAATVGPGCALGWDYPPAELERIDSFVLYVDGVERLTVPKAAQTATCAAIGLTFGAHVLEATARNAVGESAKSNPLSIVFVDSAPGAPTNVRIMMSFP